MDHRLIEMKNSAKVRCSPQLLRQKVRDPAPDFVGKLACHAVKFRISTPRLQRSLKPQQYIKVIHLRILPTILRNVAERGDQVIDSEISSCPKCILLVYRTTTMQLFVLI